MANSTVAETRASRAAVTGAIFWAPLGTALPTDATTPLAAAFKNLGYVGADGISPEREISTEDVADMNGDVLRRLQSGVAMSQSASMLQVLNEDLNKSVFGAANVTVTEASSTAGKSLAIVDKGQVADMGVMVVETFDGPAKQRRVLPVAQPAALSEPALVGTSLQQYDLQWAFYKDDSGAYRYIYNNNGVPTA